MQDEDSARKRFMIETEQAIRLANNEVIHQRIPPLTRDQVVSFAITVARLRARYLEAAFKISEKSQSEPMGDAEITSLERQRKSYEEARKAFEALTHAIERGYLGLAEKEAK